MIFFISPTISRPSIPIERKMASRRRQPGPRIIVNFSERDQRWAARVGTEITDAFMLHMVIPMQGYLVFMGHGQELINAGKYAEDPQFLLGVFIQKKRLDRRRFLRGFPLPTLEKAALDRNPSLHNNVPKILAEWKSCLRNWRDLAMELRATDAVRAFNELLSSLDV